MRSNITDQKYFAGDMQLSEPHFDEEATMLSARPVVPLGDFPAQPRTRRNWAFGAAIVVAILAGALGASLYYQRSNDKPATAIEDNNNQMPDGGGVSAGAALSGADGTISDSHKRSAGGSVATVDAPNKVAVSERQRAIPQFKKSTTRTSPRDESESAYEPQQDEAVSQEDEREMRRADRMEERRLRREARHEGKGNDSGKRRRANDILRIREIFEGSPRP